MNTLSSKDVTNSDIDYVLQTCHKEFEVMGNSNMLITGGAGFLGYYFVNSILKWNEENPDKKIYALVLDNFIRGVPDWLKKLSIRTDLKILDQSILEPLPKDFPKPNYIIHAASIASPIFYRKHPIATMDANVNGLRVILDYCVADSKETNGILYFSTSEIYGDPDPLNIPTKETYRGNVSCTGPRACYDESKRYGETMCVNFAKQYKLPIKIARPFNNYGPGLKITDGRALPDFAKNILSKKDIVLLSDGSPTRTFCYISDAIIGYFKVLVNGKAPESYNIGTESPEISILDLAKRCIEVGKDVLGYEVGLKFQDSSDKNYLIDNPNRRCPDIAKARLDLGYNPSISLHEGLTKSFIWYKENRSSEES